VSNPDDSRNQETSQLQAFSRLERAVAEAGARIGELRRNLEEARGRGLEMEGLLKKFTGGEEDPSELLARLQALEAENRDLRERLDNGKAGVERLLARIRFLEEQG
jgi:predicted RNase H-like nuclease (RuvC/YqgF family)